MDWIAAGLVMLALWLSGRKCIWTWPTQMLGCVTWLWYAMFGTPTMQWGLATCNLLILFISMRGYWLWSKQHQAAKERAIRDTLDKMREVQRGWP